MSTTDTRVLNLPWLALTATALVPTGVYAQERIAQDPHDSLRAANEAYLKQIGKNCTGDVQSQAAALCPQKCMITVPNSTLPVVDSCNPRTWSCVWPQQSISEVKSCPAGWQGTYEQEHVFDVQGCGTQVVDSGRVSPTTVGCYRDREETRNDPCPNIAGGGWQGGGANYDRFHHEVLGLDLTTVRETSVTDWKLVGAVDCHRDITRQNWQGCAGGSCYIDTINQNGVQIANTCGEPAHPLQAWTNIGHQYIASDMATVVTENFEANSPYSADECMPTCPPAGLDMNTGLITSRGCANGQPYYYTMGFMPNGTISANPQVNCTGGGVNCTGGEGSDDTGDGGGGGGGEGGDGEGGGEGGGGEGGGDDSPVTIDIDNNGFDIIPYAHSHAKFDFVPGKRARTTWVGPKDPLLALDYNGNGIIDSSREVFGNLDTVNGFEALRKEDSNSDGVINAKDKNWKKFVLWFDQNSDGMGQASELKSLDSAGVASISLTYKDSVAHTKDAFFPFTGKVTMKDGSTHRATDIFLLNSTRTLYGGDGDDVLTYSSKYLLVDGEGGRNTLAVKDGSEIILGGTEFVIRNVQVLDLRNKAANHVRVDLANLVQNSRAKLNVTIEGDKTDTVTVSNSKGMSLVAHLDGYNAFVDKAGNQLKIATSITLKQE